MKKNKIAHIIPILRLKRTLHYFDYLIPRDWNSLKPGQIVEIPFRTNKIKGVVFNLTDKSSEDNLPLKELVSLVNPEPILQAWQLKLVKYLASYYFVSMATWAKMLVPEIPKRLMRSKKVFAENIEFLTPPEVNTKIIQLNKFKKPVLIRYYQQEEKISLYLALIDKAIKANKQIAIIVPQLLDIKKIYQYLGAYQEHIVIFLNDLPKNQYWQEWSKIRAGQPKIIIGTRSAIFAPYKNLQTIIIDEEDDTNHKQEEPNPRYHVKTIALKIKELLKCNLYLVANSPSLNSLAEVQRKNWQYFQLGQLTDKPNIQIIDRQEEFNKKNFSIFSEALLNKLEYNIKRARKTFIFVNRKGLATMIACTDCGYVATCPTCHLPLTYHANKLLTCHHCGFSQSIFLTCPKCYSTNIKLTGLGTEKVESEIKKLYPLARILKLDLESPVIGQLPDYDIAIGTQYALDYLNWQAVDSAAIINGDSLFSFPDYRGMEKAFNLMVRLANLLGNAKKDLLVQTFSPQLYIFSALYNLDYRVFFIREMQERKVFHYPPFSRLIKLIYQSFEYNSGINEVEEIYKNLQEKLKNCKQIELTAPLLAHTQQVRGRWRWQMVLKVLDDKIDLTFLQDLPESVIIDVEPESLR